MHRGIGANAEIDGAPLRRRLDERAASRKTPGRLARRYLSRAHLAASRQVAARMRAAGMGLPRDALFSVFGRHEGRRPQAPAIMLRSPPDTVLDAGRYDGAFGVLAAILVVRKLSRRGERPGPVIEVAAFGNPAGMIFLRCKHSISHHAAGSITPADAEPGAQAARRLDQKLAEPGAI
jgi:hypothetical protein